MLYLLFLLLLLPNKVFGEVGLGYYGIQNKNWPCKTSLDVFKGKKYPGISVLLDRNFGDDFSCLNRFMNLPQKKRIEIHLVNEVCMKAKRCQLQNVGHRLGVGAYQNKILNNDPKLDLKLNTAFGNASNWLNSFDPASYTCFVSIGLESNLTRYKAVKKLVDKARYYFPQCKIVNSGVVTIPGVYKEYHGLPGRMEKNCVVNLDGMDIDFGFRRSKYRSKISHNDLPRYINKYQRRCKVVDLWVSEFNLKKRSSDKTLARQRTIIPSKRIFQELEQYIK